jgi:phospholipase C
MHLALVRRAMSKFDHLVVLMMENRSFDHLLGFLGHPDVAFDGLTGTESCPDGAGHEVVVSRDSRYEIASPDHSHEGANEQVFDGNLGGPPTNTGFVKSYEKRAPGKGHHVMRCFDPRMVPVVAVLAREFAVCTRWFCSVPGETWPNREFVHSATSRGLVDIVKHKLWSTRRTIFEQLAAAGQSYRIYHDDTPHSWAYSNLWDTAAKRSCFQGIAKLYDAIADDALPAYAFVEPDYGLIGNGNSHHPGQASSRDEFASGERLIHRIYDALRKHPAVFEKTIFLITYDEHGGFYDHVAPPRAAPDEAREHGFVFDRLGVRVPAIVVSPWIGRGVVDPTTYDHTAVIQTLRSRFAPGAPPLTGRDAEADVFRHLLALEQPRRGAELPTTHELSNAAYAQLERTYGAPQSAAPPAEPAGIAPEVTGVVAPADEFRDALKHVSDAVGEALTFDAAGLALSVEASPALPQDPAVVLARFRAASGP